MKVVLQVLNKDQLGSKYSKCGFLMGSVAFLGHIISSEGKEVIPKTIEMVNNWARPLTPTDIRSFFDL